MGLVEAMQVCLLGKILTVRGRASRSEFWWFALGSFIIGLLLHGFIAVVTAVLSVVSLGFLGMLVMPAAWVFDVAAMVAGITVTARRLHDIGKSGWWQLMVLFPTVAATIVAVSVGLLSGMFLLDGGVILMVMIGMFLLASLAVWVVFLIWMIRASEPQTNQYGEVPLK